jgi:hypothetical protein
MLPARRFFSMLTLPALFSLAALSSLSSPILAQVQGVAVMEFHGVPSSGIGGTNGVLSAVRPNANGLGFGATPLGCCSNFFFPSSFSPLVPYPFAATGHHERRHRHHRNDEIVGVAEPVYVPYAVPYADDSDDTAEQENSGPADAPLGDDAQERRSSSGAGRPRKSQFTASGIPDDPRQKPEGDDDSGYGAGSDSAEATPAASEEPVIAQPNTVLVFKDGHRSQVVNYAIVGDTLFDFSDDRTHKILIADLDIPATQKANDALGVEFKLPPMNEAKSAAN